MALTLTDEDFIKGEDARMLAETRIQKALYGGLLIEKAEGSRGGKVIGHTKSGKPIYDKHGHESHKNFTKQDHLDAEKIHIDNDDVSNANLHGASAKNIKTKADIEKELKEKRTKDIINGKEDRKGLAKAFESLGIKMQQTETINNTTND